MREVLPRAGGVGCPGTAQVQKASAIIRRVMRDEAKKCDESAFATVRDVLGGMIHECVGVAGMGASERRAVEWRVAAAIGNAQEVVHEMSEAYDATVRAKRAEIRAAEETAWQDIREERARYTSGVRQT